MAVLEANRVADSGGATLTVPPGTLIFHCANSAPSGFLKANGATISRSTYAALFSAIGTTFGAGDGSTTFTLPDMRGEFPRGWDDGRGIDSGRVFGGSQADEFKSHIHDATAFVFFPVVEGRYGGGSNGGFNRNVGATGGTETRPRNIALLACIKF
jgi:hypothetical protein